MGRLVADAADGILVTVRRGKTNQAGETKDVRFVKAGVARALRTVRAAAVCGPRLRPSTPAALAAASTTDVMLAGNWKTSRMVAHYSSGATAERGAVGAVSLSPGRPARRLAVLVNRPF